MATLVSKGLNAELERVKGLLPSNGTECEAIHQLSYEDVLEAHFCIADFFFREGEGIGGVGPKDISNLISTVQRQFASVDGRPIYQTPFEQIATLLFGIIRNHPFHDANKRTAFLCSLLQLHRLGRQITVEEKEFEDLMVEVADRSIEKKSALKDLRRKRVEFPEVRYLARYLEKNSRKTARLSKTIKFRELRSIVEANGFTFANSWKGTIDIVKKEKTVVQRFFFGDKVIERDIKIGTIAYHGEGIDVPDNTVKLVRQLCGLTDQDGFDGEVLLRDAQPTFQLIRSYQNALQRLAYR